MISPFSKANSPASVGSNVNKARTRVTILLDAMGAGELVVAGAAEAGAAVDVEIGVDEVGSEGADDEATDEY